MAGKCIRPGRKWFATTRPYNVSLRHESVGRLCPSKGLKFGIYTAPGRKTCAFCTGSEGFEKQDIQTFVDWGVDFIKLDWCGWVKDDYKTVLAKWRKIIDENGRPIVLSINFHRGDDYSVHRKYANMYRTTTDIRRV